MPEVAVTSSCEPTPEKRRLLLPRAAAPVGKPRVLVRGTGAKRVMKVGRRADSGPGACVPAELLGPLGGENATISYRGIGMIEAAARDGSLRLDAIVAVSTLVSAILTAYVSLIKNRADENVANIATIVAIAAFFAALAKFWKEYKAP